MNILLTGGAGYIGSIVTEQLIERGESVTIYDNLFQGHRAAIHPAARFVEGDLQDRDTLDRVFKDQAIDAVMHFASYTLVGESMEKPMKYIGDNVVFGINLIQEAVSHGVKRFILSSTANLFDRPLKMPIDEGEQIVPGSPYGESKFILERILAWLDRTVGMRYACLRYFNAAGASKRFGEDHHPETHLVPIVFKVALGKLPQIEIFGDDYPTPDGTCVRDFVHVIDLAQAHILALYALDDGSRTYNLGNGKGFSVKEVIETARRITGQPLPYTVKSRRPGDPAVLVASSERIRRELGWKPEYPALEEILVSAWEWHRSHPDGYQD
jgi:UDP-glucose 4-epimerase